VLCQTCALQYAVVYRVTAYGIRANVATLGLKPFKETCRMDSEYRKPPYLNQFFLLLVLDIHMRIIQSH
jgi:hypothetical protein